MQRYNPKQIEPKWQQQWEADKIYQAADPADNPAKPKKYILEYFPYPSGAAMHVGHVRNYTIGDVLARYNRMRGYNVLHPMGWDAFGLPAENYAIKNKISPRQAIDQNTARFKEQLIQMGFSYDWSREIDSTDPGYYRWTQWFFLLLLKRGLAYQQESLQWWCPFDKTVLANEQVEAGLCWRCGNQVEKKALKQWFFKITDYADRLEKDLDDVDWSDSIKAMQRNWIGRSQGAEIDFQIDGQNDDQRDKLTVFTTRPDTLFGATFMVVAPEHPLVAKITSDEQKDSVQAYVKAAQAKTDIQRQETDREKTGVFTGAYAINPVNDQKIPVWIADYVLYGYGTGAIMAVPAHDERDYAFAQKFELPITQVVASYEEYQGDQAPRSNVETIKRRTVDVIILNKDGRYLLQKEDDQVHFVGGGIDDVDISDEEAVRREVLEETGYTDIAEIRQVAPYIAGKAYRHTKDKNQQTWGAFYEVILASDAKVASEADEGKHELEWVGIEDVASKLTWSWHGDAWNHYRQDLPAGFVNDEGVLINSGKYDWMASSEAREKIVADLAAKGAGKEVVNYRIRDWLISRQRYWGAPIPVIHCSKDGAVPVPEDQLPVKLPEIESYEPSGDGRSPLATVPEFVNTTCPSCGGPAQRETDTMDGFACSSWYFLRFADPHNDQQPFDPAKVKYWLPVDDYIGGAEHAVMHLLYARMWTKVMHDEGLIEFDEPFTTLRNHGMILAPDGQKMSKSKGNTIEPGGLIEQGYGADSIRIMELFIGPWNQMANWSVEGMGGSYRFLQRIWTLVQEYKAAQDNAATVSAVASPAQSEAAEAEVSDLLRKLTHKVTKKVTDDLQDMGFNTAIAALMEFVNELYKIKAAEGYSDQQWTATLETLLQLLAPFAPHIAEELWSQLGHDQSVHISGWPDYDEQYLVEANITLVVQVNGKLRAQLQLPAGATQEQAESAAKAEPNVAAHLEGKQIVKTIFVPGKLINFAVK